MMERGWPKGSCLFVGGDDSNHAGKTNKEIIVATFSFDHRDSFEKYFGSKRASGKDIRRFMNEGGDYRFMIRTHKVYRRGNQNVPNAIPTLIEDYLYYGGVNVYQYYELFNISIGIDGIVKKDSRDFVEGELRNMEFENIHVKEFPKEREVWTMIRRKGGRKYKRSETVRIHRCPRLVWVADSIAHNLYETSLYSDISNHPKIIQKKEWVILP